MKKDELREELIGIPCIIDCHTHSGGLDLHNFLNQSYPSAQNLPDLALKEKLAGVGYFITFAMPSTFYSLDASLESFPYEKANKCLLFESSFTKGAIPFLSIWPGEEEQKQLSFAKEVMSEGRLFGFKLHSVATKTKISDLEGSVFIDFLEKNNLPIIIHTDNHNESANPNLVLDLAEKHGKIRISAAHVGYFDSHFLEEVGRFPNVFFDVSPLSRLFAKSTRGQIKINPALNYDSPSKLLESIVGMHPDKALWGTDEPWTSLIGKGEVILRSDPTSEVKILESLPASDKMKLSYVNPLKFIFGE